jgi:pimeloyl-ACP methyl ester carboxylesterase
MNRHRLISPTTFRLSFDKVFGPQTQLTEQESLEYWSLLVHNDGHLITDKLLSYIEERRENRRRWVSVLRSTEASLILVNGPADPVSGQHLADRFVKYLKNSHAEVSSLDSHIGHYPQLEAPEATFRHIQTFYTFMPHNKI